MRPGIPSISKDHRCGKGDSVNGLCFLGRPQGSERNSGSFPFHPCGKGVFPPYLMLCWLRPNTLLFDTSLSEHASNLSENPIFLWLVTHFEAHNVFLGLISSLNFPHKGREMDSTRESPSFETLGFVSFNLECVGLGRGQELFWPGRSRLASPRPVLQGRGQGWATSAWPLSRGLEPHAGVALREKLQPGSVHSVRWSRRGTGERCTWVHAATFGSQRAGDLPAPWFVIPWAVTSGPEETSSRRAAFPLSPVHSASTMVLKRHSEKW